MKSLSEILKNQKEILAKADEIGLTDVKLYKSFDPDALCVLAKPKVNGLVASKAVSLSYLLGDLLKCHVTVITPEDILEEDKKHLAENTADVMDLERIKSVFGDLNAFKVKGNDKDYDNKLREYKIVYDAYKNQQSPLKVNKK